MLRCTKHVRWPRAQRRVRCLCHIWRLRSLPSQAVLPTRAEGRPVHAGGCGCWCLQPPLPPLARRARPDLAALPPQRCLQLHLLPHGAHATPWWHHSPAAPLAAYAAAAAAFQCAPRRQASCALRRSACDQGCAHARRCRVPSQAGGAVPAQSADESAHGGLRSKEKPPLSGPVQWPPPASKA